MVSLRASRMVAILFSINTSGWLDLNLKFMPTLEKMFPRSAGIDIGSEKVFVCVEGKPVLNYRTFTSSYRELSAYLKECQVQQVAMEATGVYWITLYDMLEADGFDVWLINPSDSKNLPGRKTDVQDCQWIQQLFSYGLLRKSFIAEDIVRELRVYVRMREDHLQMGATHINHMQKAMTQMNIRLTEVLSQVHGKSGLSMIEAILNGERDAQRLLECCTADLIRRKGADILLALEGNYKEEYLFSLRQAYEGYVFYQHQVNECDNRIEEVLQRYYKKENKGYDDQEPVKSVRHHKPQVKNLHKMLLGIQDCNATILPGINDYSLLRLTAEIGNNIGQWKTEKHFVSWLGLAPGKNQSGKMNKRSKRKSITRAGQIFKLAANSLLQSKYPGLGAFARRLRARKGAAIAIKATARKLAILFYRLQDKGLEFIEAGVKAYEEQIKQQQIRSLEKRARSLNMQLVVC